MLEKTNSLMIQELKNVCDKKKKEFDGGERVLFLIICFLCCSNILGILRYLKCTIGIGLIFLKYGHLNIDGYTDADWAGIVLDRRSTYGYFTFVGVIW